MGCSKTSIRHYLARISQPLLDRMELCAEAETVSYQELTGCAKGESSAQIRTRVLAAQAIQRERYRSENWYFNSQIPVARLGEYCVLGKKEQAYMERIYEKLQLTARAYHKIIKLSRTIADLEGSGPILTRHLAEAVCYRSLDRKYWEV